MTAEISAGNREARAEIARCAMADVLEGMRFNRALYAELDACAGSLMEQLMRCLESATPDGYVEAMVDVGAETNAMVEAARALANRLNAWANAMALMGAVSE